MNDNPSEYRLFLLLGIALIIVGFTTNKVLLGAGITFLIIGLVRWQEQQQAEPVHLPSDENTGGDK